MPLIAVAEPDPGTRTEIVRALVAADFEVIEAGDGVHALRQVFSSRPAAIVTEFDLPMLGGLEFLRVMRAASDLGIVVVTANTTPGMAVRALDAGADDYLRKPLFLPEMIARLRATMRRRERPEVAAVPAADADDLVYTGPLTFDRSAQRAMLRGRAILLTRTERRLLDLMVRRLGQVCPHRYLLAAVWGEEYSDDTHYLRSYIASLRAKIEDDSAKPRLLLTEWGTGYRLAALPREDGGALPLLAASS
jgi:two-component system KDP operon response regulator KdpE